MAKTWWQKEQEKKAREGTPPFAAETETSSEHQPVFSGVPGRDEQAAETAETASSAPETPAGGDIAHAMSGSGNLEARTAPSAPGATITTKDGTFTREEWAERNKK